MPESAVIGTAIGLVLMYFVLSLICTVVNELVATGLGLRAKTLATSLRQMLDVPRLHADFYDHGLIDGGKAAVNGGQVSYMSGQNFAMALLGSLDPTKPVPGFADLEGAIRNLPDSNIRDVLLMNLTTAQGEVAKLRDNVATWFDDTMDRVSGVYKRYLKLISLAVGCVLAIVINADTIKIGRILWHDDALRAQVVQVGQQVVASRANPPSASGAAATGGAATPISSVVGDIQEAETELRPLPLGWNFSAVSWGGSWPSLMMSGVAKLVGLLMTGLALSLGAPFWFDLLSKFMNLRGAGPRPAATQAA